MNIHFILVEPAVPQNIGAAARAIKTMGFDSLWIVNSRQYQKKEAQYLAHGAGDILEKIQYFPSFKAVTDSLDFSIATTSKSRSVRYDYLNGNELPSFLIKKSKIIHEIGIVFGREEYGLKNEELKQCDIASSIPLHTSYPSLNLGQSVMLYAYILSELKKNDTVRKPDKKNQNAEMEVLKRKIEKILPEIGFEKESNIYGRIFERLMKITQDDIHILHSIANKILEKNSIK